MTTTMQTEPFDGMPEPSTGDEVPPETAPDATRRRRGRPTNAEYLSAGKVPPPPAGAAGRRTSPKGPGRKRPAAGARRRTAAEYEKSTGDVLGLVAHLVTLADPVDGEIVATHAPALAHGIGQLAAKNDLVGAWLDRLATTSDIGLVVAPLGAIVLGVAAHHGFLRSTPFAGSAVPYEDAVRRRRAGAGGEPDPVDLAAAS